MKGPYCLVSYDDGRYYVIPSKKRHEWEEQLAQFARNGGEAPRWCQRIDGPHAIDFLDYRIKA